MGVRGSAAEEPKPCLECHEDMAKRFKGEVAHAPFAERDCYACHEFHGFDDSAKLKGEVYDICTMCHEAIIEAGRDFAHAPIAEDESCTLCHDPHRSNTPGLLARSVKDLCMECHDGPDDADGTLHKPFGEFKCVACHNAHGSFFASYLKLPPGLVCIDCHGDVLDGYAPQDMHSATDLNSCDNCHSGHVGQGSHLLHRAGTALCLGCHADLTGVAEREFPHDAVSDGACLDCHIPHFEEGTLSLVEAQGDLCGGCHDLEDATYVRTHLGLAPRDCAGCHDPHGGANKRFIRPQQHPPFEDRECDTCHEEGAAMDALRSPDLCNGCHEIDAVDYHARKLVAGKVCIDCHRPHAARKPGLLR